MLDKKKYDVNGGWSISNMTTELLVCPKCKRNGAKPPIGQYVFCETTKKQIF